ncbi:MarR family transcriptional regulator [Phyllobacterium sp. YR531]|uniref:MarR family winged helix-turn-helix transcriptional regulator n=1 Tax=Phyllobacterium sp. YR531 TaxID=1144343 RepID=UPI00026FB29F|nr:MarR family transcriptional regulator [Phyllobacterium sp. YR531]EJN00442.1 hypothetical protein PMI41_03651 [Phyllobacterium sp. YR531]
MYLHKNGLTFENGFSDGTSISADRLQVSGGPAITLFRVGSSVNRLGRKLSALLQAELNRLGVQDIGPAQLMLLFTLRDGYSAIGDLGDQLGVKGSNLTYYINGLEENAYIERNISQSNRRNIHLTMLPKAREICADIDSSIEKLSHQAAQYHERGDEIAITYDTLLRLEQLLCEFSGQQD